MSSYRRTIYPDPAKLDEAIDQIFDLAKAERVPIALVGGIALQVYGSTRLTKDVDVIAYEDIASMPYIDALTFGGKQTAAPNGIDVDVIVRDDDFAPLYSDALLHAALVPGVSIPVVLPEHLVAMKMVAKRDKDSLDLKFLLGELEGIAKRAEPIARKFLGPYAVVELRVLVEEIAWRKTRT